MAEPTAKNREYCYSSEYREMNQNLWLAIPVSFLIALILTLLPMPEWTVWLRPAWVMLVLIYWAWSGTRNE